MQIHSTVQQFTTHQYSGKLGEMWQGIRACLLCVLAFTGLARFCWKLVWLLPWVVVWPRHPRPSPGSRNTAPGCQTAQWMVNPYVITNSQAKHGLTVFRRLVCGWGWGPEEVIMIWGWVGMIWLALEGWLWKYVSWFLHFLILEIWSLNFTFSLDLVFNQIPHSRTCLIK